MITRHRHKANGLSPWRQRPLTFLVEAAPRTTAAMLALAVLATGLPLPATLAQEAPTTQSPLTDEQVVALAQLALDGIGREYPNKPSNVMVGPESVQSPQQMHPAFFGCFDWHSAVHGHWLLVRVLKEYPDNSIAEEIRRHLEARLTRQHLEVEAAYFREKHNRSFERMYGWAWALRLAAELRTWDDPQAARWAAALSPLEEVLVEHTRAYLPNLNWPIRTGVHHDTAFALAQILDYARLVGDRQTETLIVDRGRDYYLKDRDYPVQYEPSGEDFFSSGLNEADLVRRILSPQEFSEWLDQFFPTLRRGDLGNLLTPAKVSDITDGKLVHLAGLNFNRAWTMQGIASVLSDDDPRRNLLQQTAKDHTAAGMEYVFSGQYEGEHWLATFAVYVFTQVGISP